MIFDVMLVMQRVQLGSALADSIECGGRESFGIVRMNRAAVGVMPDGQRFAAHLLMQDNGQNPPAGCGIFQHGFAHCQAPDG